MQYTVATLALVAAAFANPAPQAVTSAIAPQSSVPAGCMTSYSGSFEIELVNRTTSMKKRSIESRQDDSLLVLTLNNGMLMDNKGRTGYIAGKNQQLQFDSPPQAGAIYTSGFAVCSNGTLAIGGTTDFVACLQAPTEDEGAYYDIYLNNPAQQCTDVYVYVIPVGSAGGVNQGGDGQITGSIAPITQKTDGQPQVTSLGAPVTQKSDGQPQVTSVAPVAPVTQKTDGQPQVTSVLPKAPSAPASQLSDGQPRVTSILPSGALSTTRAVYQGAAPTMVARGEVLGLAAGVLAAALL